MATQKRRSQRIGAVIGGTFALLGLAGWIGSLSHVACLLSAFFEVPLTTALGVFSSVILATWQLRLPCLFGHTRLLESLLQVTLCGWQLFFAFAGAA